MSERNPSPTRRRYQSDRRAQQAQQTREAMLDAAEELFSEHGYAAVSVDQVARRAGVAPVTVYAAGGKHELLAQVVDRAITLGGPEPVGADPAGRQAADFDEPGALLDFHVANIRAFKQRGARAQRVLWRAAAADPEAAAVWARFLQRLQRGQQLVAARLEEVRALRPGVDAATAADIMQALVRPEAYDALVVDRGWSLERWCAFIRGVMERELLA